MDDWDLVVELPAHAEGMQFLAQVDLKKTTFFELDIIGIAEITSHKFDQFMAFSIVLTPIQY